ncbi:hypothetical protein ACFX13_029050 [Malus domestica]
MKARFQHIREARVLGFEVDPYTYIDTAELPFSLEDLQHLRYYFQVFSAVSLFGLTTDEKVRVARLDTYLDTRNAQIAYEERARKIRQEQSPIPDACKPNDDSQKDTESDYVAQAHEYVETHRNQVENALTHDAIVLTNPEDDDQDPMGPLVLKSSLDGDVVVEEATQVDFVTTTEDESTIGDDKLKTALDISFPRSSSTNLQHLK